MNWRYAWRPRFRTSSSAPKDRDTVLAKWLVDIVWALCFARCLSLAFGATANFREVFHSDLNDITWCSFLTLQYIIFQCDHITVSWQRFCFNHSKVIPDGHVTCRWQGSPVIGMFSLPTDPPCQLDLDGTLLSRNIQPIIHHLQGKTVGSWHILTFI